MSWSIGQLPNPILKGEHNCLCTRIAIKNNKITISTQNAKKDSAKKKKKGKIVGHDIFQSRARDSISRSVGPSVGLSVRPSVGPSVAVWPCCFFCAASQAPR